MKLYKVIDEKNESMNGGVFDWSDYLPKKNGEVGKWTPRIKNVSECSKGYHVTPYWNMWLNNSSDKVFEVEVKGLKKTSNSVGVVDKFVCESVRLIKQLELQFDEKSNTGNGNTGHWNTGDRNTGHWNTGHWNTGDRNTGNGNTGDWNSGDYNTGCFNTKEPEYYELFNKLIKKEDYKKISFPNWLYHDGNWQTALKNATKKELLATTELPNFDNTIFKEITGIDLLKFLEGKKTDG